MRDIVLATINAGYVHASLGLRSIRANLGCLRDRSEIVEFDARATGEAVADRILACNPTICGLGVYIWNIDRLTRVVRVLRRRAPGLRIAIGGPEVSFGIDGFEIADRVDCVVEGEGERVFPDLCRLALDGEGWPRRVAAGPSDPVTLLPSDAEYADADLATRIAYVESSRGCPFGCDYCLSAADRRVRLWPLDAATAAWGRLLDRGAKRIKVVDRTFNHDPARAATLLNLAAERLRPDGSIQVEMTPDPAPPILLDAAARFRPGALRVEIGIQTFTPAVAERVRRRPDAGEAAALIAALRRAGAVVHADLIAGLPGETPESFADSFDRLLAMGPDEIQAGVLKRLRGTPIGRHDDAWGMRYSSSAPYEILETRTWPAADMETFGRAAKLWDATVNRGRFRTALPLLWARGGSPFRAFMEFSNSVHAQFGRTRSLDLEVVARALFDHLESRCGLSGDVIASALLADRPQSPARPPRWLRDAAAADHRSSVSRMARRRSRAG